MTIILTATGLLAACLLAYDMLTAPYGYQDAAGFHFLAPCEREVEQQQPCHRRAERHGSIGPGGAVHHHAQGDNLC